MEVKLLPQTVAAAFVKQYYLILNDSPEISHKFYKEPSILGWPGPDGAVTLVKGLSGINDKIMSSEYKNCSAELKTVDSQESQNEGVIVLVTGSWTMKDNMKKNFCQTFFLAKQEKGYYVLNDILQFIDVCEPCDLAINTATHDDGTNEQPAPFVHSSVVENEKVKEAVDPSVSKDVVAKGEKVHSAVASASNEKVFSAVAPASNNKVGSVGGSASKKKARSAARALKKKASAAIAPDSKEKEKVHSSVEPASNEKVPSEIASASNEKVPSEVASNEKVPSEVAPTSNEKVPSEVATASNEKVLSAVASASNEKEQSNENMPSNVAPALNEKEHSTIASTEKVPPTSNEKEHSAIAPASNEKAPSAVAPASNEKEHSAIEPASNEEMSSAVAPASNVALKITYAAMVARETPVAPSRTVRVTSYVNKQPALLPTPKVSAPSGNNTPNPVPHAEARGIYIAGLPYSITKQEILDVVKIFGSVRKTSDIVQIKKHEDGFVCGFVDFESADSARRAVEARYVKFGEKEAYITYKRSSSYRGNDGGGRSPTRAGLRNGNSSVREGEKESEATHNGKLQNKNQTDTNKGQAPTDSNKAKARRRRKSKPSAKRSNKDGLGSSN